MSLNIKPGVSVPDDCQQWLLRFADAFNEKDGARILELTAPKDVLEHMARAPGAERMSMVDAAMKNVQRIHQNLGNLKSLSVEFSRESTFKKDSQPSGPVEAGRYVIDIQGEAKCAKRDAKASFTLFKNADGSDPVKGTWNLTWSPF